MKSMRENINEMKIWLINGNINGDNINKAQLESINNENNANEINNVNNKYQ